MLWRKCQLHLPVNNSQLWRLKWHLNAFEGLPVKRAQVSGVYFLSVQAFGFLFYYLLCTNLSASTSLQSSATDVKHKKNSISICFPKTAIIFFEAVYHKKLYASQLKWPPHPSQLSLTIAVLVKPSKIAGQNFQQKNILLFSPSDDFEKQHAFILCSIFQITGVVGRSPSRYNLIIIVSVWPQEVSGKPF